VQVASAGQQSALEATTKLDSGAGALQAGLGALGTGASTLHADLVTALSSISNPSQAGRKAMAQTIGNPIGVSDTPQATAGSYGAGLAPFFLSLALWIGAYVLSVLVKPLSSRALAAGQPSWRIAVGGWLPPALFGLGQAGLAFTVVFFGLRIHVAHPGAVLALMCITSVAFVAILHALVCRLGAVGTFLGLVLMVVQLVSAGHLPLADAAGAPACPSPRAADGIRRRRDPPAHVRRVLGPGGRRPGGALGVPAAGPGGFHVRGPSRPGVDPRSGQARAGAVRGSDEPLPTWTRRIPRSGGSCNDDNDADERAHPDPGSARQG